MKPALAIVWLICAVLASECAAEIVYLCATAPCPGGVIEAKGSAVCVGRTAGRSVLLTARHNLSGMHKVWVQGERDWVECRFIASHPSEDVALLEVPAKFRISPIAIVSPDTEIPCTLEGVGPHVHAQRSSSQFRCRVRGDLLVGSKGEHAIPGDSGGPVYCDGAVIGIVSMVKVPQFGSPRPTNRLQYRGTTTRIVRTNSILKWMQTQYQCGPQGCPIILRPSVRQPMAGIAIPMGPPQVIHEAIPAPRRYVPEPTPDPLFSSDDEAEPESEPRVVEGPRGPPGKDGRDGRNATEAEIRSAVNAWMDENADSLRGRDGADGHSPSIQDVASIVKAVMDKEPSRFRGAAGPPGPAGPQGPPGQRGAIGVPDDPDMKAVVRGWLADPETRTWLVDELSQDLRIQDLIHRLEAVESRGSSGDPVSSPNRGVVVSKFVLVRSGSNARVDAAVANARKQWDDIIEVSKDEIPRNVIVKTYPTLIAFSPDGDVAGMWESEYSVLNTLARISSGQYP